MTAGQSLAIAVLRGDMAAALALCDKVKEEANQTQQELADLCEETFQAGRAMDGYAVYSWPEFKAFAKRLGFMWNLRTVECTIVIREGSVVTIDHKYQGVDMPVGEPIPTTTMHNQQIYTYSPATHNGEALPGSEDMG